MKAVPRARRRQEAGGVRSKRVTDTAWIVAAFAAPLALGLVLRPLEQYVGTATVTLVLVVPVVVVAAAGRRAPALAATVAGALAFDYLYTEPRASLAIFGVQDIVATAVFLAVGMIVVAVSRWGRRQVETANRTVNAIVVLRSLVELMTLGEDDDIVLMHTAFWLRDLLHLRDCRYDVALDPASPATLGPGDSVHMGEFDWPVDTAGLPGDAVDLLLTRQGTPFARFVLIPAPGRTLHRDRIFTAAAVADLVATWLALRHPDPPPPDLRSVHG
jgi:hypothetical protein